MTGAKAALTVAVLVLAGPVHAQDLDWLTGPWQIEYQDTALGKIVGIADIRNAGATVASGSLYLGRVVLFGPDLQRYELSIDYFRVDDGAVQVHLKGAGPPSGLLGVPAGIRADVETIPARENDVIQAAWGNARTNARVVAGDPVDLYVEFPIPGDGKAEQLHGTWRYQPGKLSMIPENRGGDISDDGIRIEVSGRETWRRPSPRVTMVVAEDASTVAALPRPPQTGFRGPLWLSATGFGLPVQPKRVIVPEPGKGIALFGPTRVHPDEPASVQVAVIVDEDLPPDPVRIVVNGAEGRWLPVMPGIEPESLRFVRQHSETEYFAAQELVPGDVVYLEARYAKPPFPNRMRFGLLVDDLYAPGSAPGPARDSGIAQHAETIAATMSDDPPGRKNVVLRRAEEPALYRSGPILVRPADPADLPRYVDVGDYDGESIEARSDVDEILAWEIDPVAHGNPKNLVSVPVRPRPDTTLWPDAMHTAQRCRDEGRSETEYWNIGYLNAVTRLVRAQNPLVDVALKPVPVARTLPGQGDVVLREEITLEDHAAALLMRRQLVSLLTQQIGYLNSMHSVSDGARQALIAAGFRRDNHPLLKVEVEVPGNNPYTRGYEVFEWPLGMLLSRRMLEITFEGNVDAYEEFVHYAVSQAVGRAASTASASLQRAQAVDDCDVLELLVVTGRKMDGLVDLIRPKLVREDRDPAAFPRFVPDRDAIRALTGVRTRQESVEGIEALSNAQLDVVLTLATLGVASTEMYLGSQGLQALNAVRVARLGSFALDRIDDARLVQQASAYFESQGAEYRFSQGIVGVVGDARLVQAVERDKQALWGLATASTLRFLTFSMSAGDVMENGMGMFVRPGTTAQIVQKAALEGMDSLNTIDRMLLDALHMEVILLRNGDYSELDVAIARLFGMRGVPGAVHAGSAGPTPAGAAMAGDALPGAGGPLPLPDDAGLRGAHDELVRQGLGPADANRLQSAAARDAEVVGTEGGATLAALRDGRSADELAAAGVPAREVDEALEQLRRYSDPATETPEFDPRPIPEGLREQLEDLGYHDAHIDELTERLGPSAGTLSEQQAAIRAALEGGTTIEEIVTRGYSRRDILFELDLRRLEDELGRIDARRQPLPDLNAELVNNSDLDLVQVFRARGLSDTDIAEEFFRGYSNHWGGNLQPFMEGDFMGQLAGRFGDDFQEEWLERFAPRFVPGSSPGSRSSAAADTVTGQNAAGPAINQVSVYSNGRRIEIPVGELVGQGASHTVYRHPTNPRILIRVNVEPASRALDDMGWDHINGLYRTESGVMLRGPRRRMVLSSDCYDSYTAFANDLNAWHRLEGGAAFRASELMSIFSRRNVVEYIEVARGNMARNLDGWASGHLTDGQIQEIRRNLDALNREGLVLLDSHGNNLYFERVAGTADEWRMHIIDSGAVVRVRGETAAERAGRAREVQRMITAPDAARAAEMDAAGTELQRFAIAREAGADVRDQVFSELDDATRAALGSADNLHYVPELGAFQPIRDFVSLSDAERTTYFPDEALQLVR